jgi:uncharacterized protein YoxC
MDWAQILVVILSVFLAVFLLLGIVLTALLIKVTRQIKSVTDSAERTAHNIEGIVSSVTKFTSPAFFMRMVTKHFKKGKK